MGSGSGGTQKAAFALAALSSRSRSPFRRCFLMSAFHPKQVPLFGEGKLVVSGRYGRSSERLTVADSGRSAYGSLWRFGAVSRVALSISP
jgi:hypothetical protein